MTNRRLDGIEKAATLLEKITLHEVQELMARMASHPEHQALVAQLRRFKPEDLARRIAERLNHRTSRRPKTKLPNDNARFVDTSQAAAMIPVSVGTFNKMVATGIMPPPVPIPGVRRRLFDKAEVIRACAALSGSPDPTDQAPNWWDRVLRK
jgi:hypothetical protein